MNDTVMREILFANETFYMAFSSGDFTTMDDLWAREADVICTHPGWSALEGRELVMESWRSILSNDQQSEVQCSSPVAHLYNNVALVTCHELIDESALSVTNAFILENGRWRMIHHHAGPMAIPPQRISTKKPAKSGTLH